MASVDIPPLIAGSGDLAVVYRTAAYLWGSWSATYPDGVTPPQMEPGRELGYVGDLRADVTDLGSRCWTRADVQVDAVEHYSNVPEVFDVAEQRTAGEVFFEQDLEGPALGRLTPNVDFHVGDVVPVLVAGKLIDLPVTSITAVSRVGDEIGWQVHIGGQLVADERALEAENAGLERQILREAKQFAREKGTDVLAAAKAFAETGDVAALEAAKTDATTKADQALSAAKTYSEGLVTPVATRLDQLGQDFKTQTGRVDTLTTSQEGTASKLQAVVNGDPGGLLTGTAFEKNQRAINEMQAVFNAEQVGINTGFRKLFALQDEINAQTTELDRAQTARITDLEQLQAIRDVMDRNTEKMLNYVGDFAQYVQNRSYMLIRREYVTGGYGGYYTSDYGNYFTLDQSKSDRVTIKIVNKWSGFLDYSVYSSDGRSERYVSTVKNGVITQGFGTGRSDTFIKWGSQKISTYVITAVPGTWPNGSESVPPKFPRLEPLPIVKKG